MLIHNQHHLHTEAKCTIQIHRILQTFIFSLNYFLDHMQAIANFLTLDRSS
jgi:hypothetical protein